MEQVSKTTTQNNNHISTIYLNKEKYGSYCDTPVKSYIQHEIKCILLGIFTLGLAYPWILCMKYESKYKHTVICGKRMKFIGEPKDLIRHWIVWWPLCIITCGIYTLVVKLRFERWAVANIVFEDVEVK